MSFKYRFILSFVLLEIFFIVLIVTVNFIAIKNSSEQLNNQKVESNVSFLEELVKIPISIYDIATLDNLVNNSKKLEYINSIVILDSQERIISSEYDYSYEKIDDFLKEKKDRIIAINDENYEIKFKKIYEEDVHLGSIFIVFDSTENYRFINNNKNNTLFIIAIEILVSTILSYLIGIRLTNKLTVLSDVASLIGENKHPEIPFQSKGDEIGILAKSMNQMQIDLKNHNDKLAQLALTLNKQKNELFEANEYKNHFLANISHELKTPLNSINVISSIMMKNKNKSFNEKEEKNLKIINRCGNDLLYLINDILDISKIEAGEIELDIRSIDTLELMTEIKEMFEPQVKEKGLNFVFTYDEKIGNIDSDKHRIKQIIKNLLSNALKFTKSGNIEFHVVNKVDNISIIVKDDGIGIDETKLEHIFDRFKQADGSTTRKYGGTGLGLSICKELLNLLNGDIKVVSKLNYGTAFVVTIPKMINKEKNQVLVDEVTNIDDILILNDNPVLFLQLSLELKKTFNLKQVSNIDDLIKNMEENKYRAIVINYDENNDELIENTDKLLDGNKLVVIYSDQIGESIKNRAYLTYRTPINVKEIVKSLTQ